MYIPRYTDARENDHGLLTNVNLDDVEIQNVDSILNL